MKAEEIADQGAISVWDDPPQRTRSKLEILTADNVGPALEAMLSSLDRLDDRVRLVAERDGTILAAGHGMADWLTRSDGLVMKNQKLKATGHTSQDRLDRILGVEVGQIETEVLDRVSSDGHCILRSAGLCHEAVAITMQLAHAGFEPKLADMETAFGLTPSESHVVEMLLQGLGAQEIAGQLSISVHTVRAHLRHCYDKLEVSSREELWQKLAPYRLN